MLWLNVTTLFPELWNWSGGAQEIRNEDIPFRSSLKRFSINGSSLHRINVWNMIIEKLTLRFSIYSSVSYNLQSMSINMFQIGGKKGRGRKWINFKISIVFAWVATCGMKFKFVFFFFSFRRYRINIYICIQTMNPLSLILAELSTTTTTMATATFLAKVKYSRR